MSILPYNMASERIASLAPRSSTIWGMKTNPMTATMQDEMMISHTSIENTSFAFFFSPSPM